MKKVLFSLICLVSTFSGFAQSTGNNNYMQTLESASRNPLLTTNSEIILIDGTSWERVYGESEFILAPTLSSIEDYSKSIAEASKKAEDMSLSVFNFYNVDLNSDAKSILAKCGILIPTYYNLGQIKVMLPKVHYLEIRDQGVSISQDLTYGQKKVGKSSKESQTDVIFYSQGFEQATNPFLVDNTGATACGWGRESCGNYTGSWSMWCSNTGAGCESCLAGGWHVNNVTSAFQPSSVIPVSNYTNKLFSYAIWSDLYDLDLTDYCAWYYAFDNASSFTLSTEVFYSNSSIDELGWQLRSITITGGSTFTYAFSFYSDGSITGPGVYIDDIKMSGTSITGVEELVPVSSCVYPNPASNTLNIKSNENPTKVEILDLNGRLVLTSGMEKQINISEISSGLYTVRVHLKGNVVTEKFIKE
jgi:hypothetical protein